MRGSERVIAEASLLGALPLTDTCQTGANFADMPVPTVVPMANTRGGERAYATSLYAQVVKMMDEYWDLLPLYAPYRQVGKRVWLYMYLERVGVVVLAHGSYRCLIVELAAAVDHEAPFTTHHSRRPAWKRYCGINAATLHEDMATFLHSLDMGQGLSSGNGSTHSSALMGRGEHVKPCLGC